MAINVPTTRLRLDHVIHHFRSTAKSKYSKRKNIRIREKIVYTTKFSGFKSFRIQSSHIEFRIKKLRRHDQTGESLFRIRSLLCKWQNQSGTKAFRIHHESGTISSSVNLVSKLVYHSQIKFQLMLFRGSCVILVIRLTPLCSQFL